MVVQEVDGALVETPWRIEREFDGYRLSHADDNLQSGLIDGFGASNSPEAAVERLRGSS
ncbi:hypothetical protein [Herbiconiux ginsengi]|uniref:Uncharacterized protein n=1 Tax=Herbiconiux ginsengi TaxID=381665 RepID=A0A1H3TEH0_9MICO|nr:hypothetical protein [Herbiconiux ginsengi]SDZ48703.1 hypothetical protein SAMN05216554_4151 [Herbiconiux ginsengi]